MLLSINYTGQSEQIKRIKAKMNIDCHEHHLKTCFFIQCHLFRTWMQGNPAFLFYGISRSIKLCEKY